MRQPLSAASALADFYGLQEHQQVLKEASLR